MAIEEVRKGAEIVREGLTGSREALEKVIEAA